MHDIQDLIRIFNRCFESEYQTQLVLGDDEPMYVPASLDNAYHRVYFAHGYYSSALHECAHWLIAGDARRQSVDYGYWYVPDGRNAAEQALFQQVEVKPQALEWILSAAALFPFQLSLDNLNGAPLDTATFKKNVIQQVRHYCQQGLPARAAQFRLALCTFYDTPHPLMDEHIFEMSHATGA